MNKIAMRYTQALIEGATAKEITAYQAIFETLAQTLEDEKVKSVLFSPYMSDEDRAGILLASVASVKSDKINNLMKLLVEKRRIGIIGAMSDSLAALVADESKKYTGTIYSNTKMKKDTVKSFETSIGNRVDAKLSMNAVQNEYNGVKVEVESLGVEVSFSKSNVRNQMIQHILKSI